METADSLKTIIRRHRELLSELEAEQRALEGSGLAKENAALKAELERLRADFERLRQRADLLADDNARYRNALYEQVYNDRANIVNAAAQRAETYFRSSVEWEMNRLAALEYGIAARIGYIRDLLARNYVDAQDHVYAALDEAARQAHAKIAEARAYAEWAPGAYPPQGREAFERLKNEQITDEQIREVAKKGNFERFVGLNVLNAAGILLLIIGAATLALFAYFRLPDLFKGILVFALGGGLLAVGELLNRKKPTVFSLGISAGGIGILYTAMITGYLSLRIIGPAPAIAICVLITAGAFALSTRYGSQTIAAFALVGGYLPVFSIDSIGSDIAMASGAMAYFVALNLFVLLISFGRKWRVTVFIGLFLNIAATWLISSGYPLDADAAGRAPLILYISFAFLVFTCIPIVSTYRTRAKFSASDVALLAINTVSSSLVMYSAFAGFGLDSYFGPLALIFAAAYLSLGKLVERVFAGEARSISALFYLTGLAFMILFVPLQFGSAWLSLGWLVEGVLLAVYGILKTRAAFRRAGLLICLPCLIAFASVDCLDAGHPLFPFKYLAITLGSLAILAAFMRGNLMADGFARVYRLFALANAWLFTAYIVVDVAGGALYAAYGRETPVRLEYLIPAAAIALTFFYAYLFQRIRLLYGPGLRALSNAMYAIGILSLLGLNALAAPAARQFMRPETPSPGITLIAIAALAAIGILSVLAARDMMRAIVAGRRLSVEWYPLILSGYSVIILSQILIAQFGIPFSSPSISIIYALTALAWIAFGFSQRYSFVRRFGLGLAAFTVAKLFLADLVGLTQGYRIISYFALGGTLIAISFVYQRFSRLLELKGAAGAEAPEPGELGGPDEPSGPGKPSETSGSGEPGDPSDTGR